ncbi:mitochondrial ATPase expression domain-containing protein [Pochonia chlamydosporia 170]|uniref:Mitochondrial ATPase expression domain-containing protein n=1 Tax=Pochonia chlamydosporia 170 TaxID=1380566 RepID=A0A179G6R9_METCM|nr:mitochondrial ATPase expression domain-containing protein [Pochonia chlamydosporia 170]OAQ73487.1 mitochondrial ATPase expression domain-containing protein [Pochonia chlamydosporia 170]
MALRRPLWPKSSLNRLCTSRTDLSPQAVRCANSKLLSKPRQRHLATHVATATATAPRQHHFNEFLPPRDRTELDDVLSAVQSQNPDLLYKAFLQWTDILGNPSSPLRDAAIEQAQELPGPSFSEILRSIDPLITSRKHDVAHGLNLTQGQTQFTDTSKWVDEFGVRDHHRQVLRGMQILMEVRTGSPYGLTPADFEVFLRCAGAAADYQATKNFWATMAPHGLQDARTAKTWTEFIKSRFLIEPTYYQFDRSRVAVMARDLYSNRRPLPMATLKRMDNMRHSINAFKREPWNRRPDELDEDMRRLLRRRIDFRGYKGHWVRALYYGREMDEELLCASLIAFARSSSLHSIKTLILENYYGINIVEDAESSPGNPQISGGIDLPPHSPIKPTEKLLNAIVEAFGSMSHIPLGMKLLDFVSQRYDIPIPHETWSNLLNWTYLCASKPFKPMRKLHGDFQSTFTTAADVREVFNVMTSPPYNITPTFDNYDIYIKTLIAQRSFGRALTIVRNDILPFYEAVINDYELAVQDEILQNDLGPSPQATHRRHQAQLYKDHIHHRISSWFDKLLKTASANKGHRDGAVMKTMIPNLVVEFADFFPHQIRYRTAQGVVQIDRPEATRRFEWVRRWRETLPQKKAGIHARGKQGSDEPDFAYPMVPTLRLLEWQRRPRRRMDNLGRAPKDAESRSWWDRLEEELVL